MQPQDKTKPAGAKPYLLSLFVTDATPRCRNAIVSIRRICEERLKGRYALKVVDICRQPAQAKVADIVAVPTLLKQKPLPLRKIIGDLSNTERVLAGLGL